MNERTRRWLGIGRWLAMLACAVAILWLVDVRSVGAKLLHFFISTNCL